MRWLLVLAFAARGTLSAGTAADFVRSLQGNSFDPSECYRVRDITIFKEDLKIYLTDGHLIFSRPVAGRRIAAAFTADVDAGDGEVILMPPNRAERTSLASYTNSPNLDEHFRAALFIFTGSDYDAILSQLPKNSANRKVTDVADAMVRTAQSGLQGEVFNVGSGGSYSINALVELLGGEVVHLPKRPGEPDCTFADTRRIEAALGWKAQVPFPQGVARMLEHIELWRNAPVWDTASVAEATRDWFKYLAK